MITGPMFTADKVHLWKVDNTPITIITDADMPLGKVREMLAKDLNAYDRNTRDLPCVHCSESFQGVRGTNVHGRGWKLHVPQAARIGLMQAVEIASMRDWTEVVPAKEVSP